MVRSMNRIGDYALLGDCHSTALVGRDGSVDWACFPRHDAPAVFSRILDADRGGFFSVAPDDDSQTRRAYLPGTNVLVTTLRTPTGVLEVADCMPVEADVSDPRRLHPRHAILRRIRCTEGSVTATLAVEPRFDYGSFVPRFGLTSEETAEIVGGADALWVTATRLLEEERERIRARWYLRAGDEEWVEAAWTPSHVLRRVSGAPDRTEFKRRFEATVAFWRGWSSSGSYEGAHAEAVQRSALVLKALTYAPTGALVAAPTTSLPESVGGGRNWDYRYTWIRDATLTLISLLSLGYRAEADAFKFWLERTSAGRPEDLQIMYGIGGERLLPEIELAHLAGHRGSAPVRIGNGAAKQRQLDAYGQLLQAAFLYGKAGGAISPENWNFLAGLADIVCDDWRQPDQGIWEIRDEPRHFVHSKLNCWAALDRAVRLATIRRLPAPVSRWKRARDEIRSYLLADAVRRGWFPQAVGADAPDASALLVPAMGFLPASHPLCVETVEMVRSVLADGALVRRYLAPDGLGGEEGAFLLCSFWLIDDLIYSGGVSEAESLLEEVLGLANDVGLFSEEVDTATGEALGNFPQAFTHMALVTSCVHLEAAKAGALPIDEACDYAEIAVDRLLPSGRSLA